MKHFVPAELEEKMEDGTSGDTDDDVSINSMTDSDSGDSTNEINVNNCDKMSNNEDEEEEEEDEVVKAIKREREKCQEHPPDIQSEDFVVDISFHPKEEIIAAATITGDVIL
jgi:hypothetical protein